MKVFILVIDNKMGTDITAYSCEEQRSAAIYQYCADNWSWEDDPPEDNEILVETFWERVNLYGEEWYKTEEVEL